MTSRTPYRPPPPFDTQYAERPYYGEVAATDAALAPLVDDVQCSARPTLVIVTGDHGEGLGEHGEESHGLFAYEFTLRIPLIVAEVGGEKRTPAGEVSSVAALHIDILPTILDAVGQPVPSGLPGRTLLPRNERDAGAPARWRHCPPTRRSQGRVRGLDASRPARSGQLRGAVQPGSQSGARWSHGCGASVSRSVSADRPAGSPCEPAAGGVAPAAIGAVTRHVPASPPAGRAWWRRADDDLRDRAESGDPVVACCRRRFSARPAGTGGGRHREHAG